MRRCALLLLLGGCATSQVSGVLDELHRAAAAADEERYFALFSKDAVFLGTDATERWTLQEFRAYAHPHFAAGRGWTYHPRDRNVFVEGEVAWFDERLDHAEYGELRGTGVLRQEDGKWRIVQYNLAFPVPNEIADEVVERIRKGP